MRALSALIALAVLLGIVYVGVGLAGQEALFGVVIPYAAIVIFLVGLTYRILRWAGAPVPYRIPTTCGQEVSLPWIEASRLENPPNTFWTVLRMAFEVLLFRSLFRNTRVSLRPGQKGPLPYRHRPGHSTCGVPRREETTTVAQAASAHPSVAHRRDGIRPLLQNRR